MNQTYDSMFAAHDRQKAQRQQNGEYLAEIISGYMSPKTVIDVGCGLGFFLAAMARRGAKVHGLDADWVVPLETEIEKDQYTFADLNQPIDTSTRYDLAVSLEVAEHLKPERGASFVADLCGLSDVVLFSAAIPGQRGSGHIHLQWQDWWADQFAGHGYKCYDAVRRKMAAHEDAFGWFKQNVLIFARDGAAVDPRLLEHEIAPVAASYVYKGTHLRKLKQMRKQMDKK